MLFITSPTNDVGKYICQIRLPGYEQQECPEMLSENRRWQCRCDMVWKAPETGKVLTVKRRTGSLRMVTKIFMNCYVQQTSLENQLNDAILPQLPLQPVKPVRLEEKMWLQDMLHIPTNSSKRYCSGKGDRLTRLTTAGVNCKFVKDK